MFTDDQKRTFALRFLEARRDACKAAARLFPFDIAARNLAQADLPFDPVVIDETDRLLREYGHDFFLPGKHELAAKIYDVADTARDIDDKVKGFKLYADVMGFVDKPGVTVNNNVQNNINRVMVLREHGSAEQWEAGLVEQQRRLAHDSGGAQTGIAA